VSALIEWLIEVLGRFVIATISTFGYTGIVLTMAIESACIPLPSEIIMPFSGYLVFTGQFSMVGATLHRRIQDSEFQSCIYQLVRQRFFADQSGCWNFGWRPSHCHCPFSSFPFQH